MQHLGISTEFEKFFNFNTAVRVNTLQKLSHWKRLLLKYCSDSKFKYEALDITTECVGNISARDYNYVVFKKQCRVSKQYHNKMTILHVYLCAQYTQKWKVIQAKGLVH